MKSIKTTKDKIYESIPEIAPLLDEIEQSVSDDAAFPLHFIKKGFCWNSRFIKKCNESGLLHSMLFNILWRSFLTEKKSRIPLTDLQRVILKKGFGFEKCGNEICLNIPPKNGIYLSPSCVSIERLYSTTNHHGPAKYENTGSRYYFRRGQLTRPDGPAIEHYDGETEWWLDEKSYDPPVNIKNNSIQLKRWWAATVILNR